MQIAVLVFEGVTALDAVGPFQVLSHLPGAEVLLVGEAVGEVRTEGGHLGLVVDATFEDAPNPDVIVIPGGTGHTALLTDGPTQRWLVEADRTSTWTTSVCTGALVLGAAGLLRGRRATTHWLALDRLSTWAAQPTSQRVVIDGKYMTAAGVSAGLDMALSLAARLRGEAVAQAIQLGLEYDPQPPYDSGSPMTAPRPIADAMRTRARIMIEGR